MSKISYLFHLIPLKIKLLFSQQFRIQYANYEKLIDRKSISNKYENIEILNFKTSDFFITKCLVKLDPNPFFDSDWYIREHLTKAVTVHDPLWHYVKIGEKSDLCPNPFFKPSEYLKNNPDLFKANINLLWHFMEFGIEEGRIANQAQLKISIGEKSADQVIRYRNILEDVQRIALIIPVFNNWAFTERCLNSITKTTDFQFLDIFVINDGSTDGTLEELNKYKFVTVINTGKNLGFTKACNYAFQQINNYKFIYLMNNDTEAIDGFIANAYEVFLNNPNAALVGSRLIFSDGTLQESGSVIWNDASGFNYGRGEDPDNPKYFYTREVDYCSGAGILIKYSELLNIGGFDEDFSPGYYEDTDLAFKFRTKDKKVLVSGSSNIYHHEGKSHGTDLTVGVKKYQEINKEKFKQKWSNDLITKHLAASEINVEKAGRRLCGNNKIILWIDARIPRPREDSGSLRAFSLISIFNQLNYQIVFVPDDGHIDSSYADSMRNYGVSICKTIDDAFTAFGKDIQLIWVSRYPVYLRNLSQIYKYFPNVMKVFDTVDLHGIREKRQAEFEKSDTKLLDAEKSSKFEALLAEISDFTITVSETEKDYLQSKIKNKNIQVIGNIHSISEKFNEFEDTSGLVFVGSFGFEPNLVGVKWFIEKVFPLLPEEIQKHGLKVIGSDIPPELKNLESDLIHIIGWVKETKEYIQSSRVSIAPLLYGAGVKGKVGEAMSLGTPTVLTSIAAEGLGIENGHEAMIANTPEEFAQAIRTLYTNESIWSKVQKNAGELTVNNFSMNKATESIKSLINSNTNV